jgi:TRAP-type mannitol/chloroaromatic compound transport system permease small subunit
MEESCRTFIPTHNLPFSMLSYHPTVVISYITQKQISMLILHLIYVKIISCRQIIISVIIDADDRALEYQVYFFTAVFLITSATVLTDLSNIDQNIQCFN